MEKTISIGLGGQNFIIEEDAAAELKNYLEDVRRHCGPDTDSDEVMADIEAGLAEKLKGRLSAYKEIVTAADIDELIKVMGTNEDFDREVGTAPAGSPKPRFRTGRRLYRDPDDAMIGGVCAGLGAYFDIDPIIFRFAFLALCFAHGSGLLLYIIMWIVMPAATTSSQKLEMKGEQPTVAAFERLSKSGRELKGDWKKRWQERSWFGKILSLPILAISALFLVFKKIMAKLAPILRVFVGLFLIAAAVAVIVGAGIAGLYALLQAGSGYKFEYVPIKELTAAIPFGWMVITGFLAFALPAALVLIGGLSMIRKERLASWKTLGIIAALWLLSGISFTALSLRYLPEVKDKINSYPILQESEKTVPISDLSSVNIKGRHLLLKIEPAAATTSSLEVEGRNIDLSGLSVHQNGGVLDIEEAEVSRRACFDCHLEPITVTVSAPSLKAIASEGADLDIASGFRAPLRLNVSDANVRWVGASADSLDGSFTGSSFNLDGRLASSTLKLVDSQAELKNLAASSTSLYLDGDRTSVTLKGSAGRLAISGPGGDSSPAEVNASSLKVGALSVASAGNLLTVCGPADKIDGDLSGQAKLYYSGHPRQISLSAGAAAASYQKVSVDDYEAGTENNDGGLAVSATSSLVAGGNGKYFRLERGSLSAAVFRSLSETFRDWLE